MRRSIAKWRTILFVKYIKDVRFGSAITSGTQCEHPMVLTTPSLLDRFDREMA